MRICYIKQIKNIDEYISYTNKIKSEFIKKIIRYYKKIFNSITVKPIGDGIIFYLPDNKKMLKLINKVNLKLNYYNIKNIVIDNNLNINILKNSLYENNINILNGRWLFNYLLIDIIQYITKLRNENLANQEISIMANDLNEMNINNIYEIAGKVKRLNIVTNNIEKFKNIEKKLYDEKGIMITVSNNKRKSLVKARIIVNIDFSEEMINKYSINKKAILINIENKVKINSKSFSGININYYNIEVNSNVVRKFIENKMYQDFDKNILYESIIYDKVSFQNVRKRMSKDKLKLTSLIGNNGIINEKEFETKNL